MTIGLVYQMEYFYGELPGKTSQRTSPHSSPKDTTEEEKEKKKSKLLNFCSSQLEHMRSLFL